MTANITPAARLHRNSRPNTRSAMGLPQAGDLVAVTRAASVQFDGDRAILLSVIDVTLSAYTEGWCYLTGYEVKTDGAAAAKREVFVRIAGLRIVRRTNTLPRQRRGGMR